MYLPVQNDDSYSSIRPLSRDKEKSSVSGGLIRGRADDHRIGRNEPRDVSKGEVHRILQEFIVIAVNNDGRVHEVVGPVGSSLERSI